MDFKNTDYEEYGNSISIIGKNLTSLKGRPKNALNFHCCNNDLISLKFCPKEIGGVFDCSENMIENLKYSPKIIKGSFNCSENKLTSLKGGPKIVGNNYTCKNNMLKTLEGRPKEIVATFDCSKNNLSSLKHRPKQMTVFNCKNNVFLKNQKQQIIENGIKAGLYITDEGTFPFKDIKEEFEKHNLLGLENTKIFNKIKENNYGLSI